MGPASKIPSQVFQSWRSWEDSRGPEWWAWCRWRPEDKNRQYCSFWDVRSCCKQRTVYLVGPWQEAVWQHARRKIIQRESRTQNGLYRHVTTDLPKIVKHDAHEHEFYLDNFARPFAYGKMRLYICNACGNEGVNIAYECPPATFRYMPSAH